MTKESRDYLIWIKSMLPGGPCPDCEITCKGCYYDLEQLRESLDARIDRWSF